MAKNTKLKMLIISNNITSFGGTERWILDLNEEIGDKLSIKLFMPKQKKSSITRKELGRKYHNFDRINCEEFEGPFKVASQLKRPLDDADVVYITTMSPLINIFALTYASMRARKKCIFAFHNNYFADLLSRSRGPLYVAYNAVRLRFVTSLFDNFHVLNGEDKRLLQALHKNAKIFQIPNFIRQTKTNILKKLPNEFKLLFVGRLSTYHKGIDLLEKAVEHVLVEQPDVLLDIVGTGPGEDIAKKLEAKHPRNIAYKGFLFGKELTDEYESASILAFPSRYETFGLVMAEAQIRGLPVQGFDVRGTRDVVSKELQGRLAKPFDTLQFAEGILYYKYAFDHDKKAYLDMKKDIAENAKKEFGAENVTKRLFDMLQKVAKN